MTERSASTEERRARLPASTLIIVYLALLLLLPARLVLPGMGDAGQPAVAFGLGLLLWWTLTHLHPALTPRDPQPVRWLIALLAISVLWAYALGLDRGLLPLEGRSADRYLIVLGSQIGVALAISDGLRSREEVDKVLRRLVLFASLAACVGILQFYGVDLAPYVRVPGLVLNAPLVGLGERGGPAFNRVYGTQQHYIEFGVVLAAVMPLAVHAALEPVQRQSWRWAQVALLVAAVPFSISRAAFLGLITGFLVLSMIWPLRLRLRAYALAVLGLVVFRLLVPGVLGTIRSAFQNTGTDPSILNRTADYAATADYIKERPWFGRGPGTFVPEVYRVLDNQFLLTLLEGGVVGVVAMSAVFLGPYLLGRSVRRRGSDRDAHLGQAIAASAAVGFLASFTFDSLGFPTFSGLAFVLLGLAGAHYRLHEGVPPAGEPRRLATNMWRLPLPR